MSYAHEMVQTRTAKQLVRSEAHYVLVGVIWAVAAVLSVFAPDLVSGSEQEHIPIAVLTVWLWAVVATTFVLMTPRAQVAAGWAIAVGLVWMAVMVIGLAAPQLVTGTDPTSIPLGAMVAPPVGSLVTGLICMRQATSA
jgi:hypothetical protein